MKNIAKDHKGAGMAFVRNRVFSHGDPNGEDQNEA